MGAETMPLPSASTIRAFRKTDAAAATEILKGSLEAAQWTEWGVSELLGWSGVVALALVSEDGHKVRFLRSDEKDRGARYSRLPWMNSGCGT